MHLESCVADVAKARGLPTIAALASAAGLPPSTVRRYWGTLPRRMYHTTLTQLCKALDAQPGDLFVLIQERTA